jgi:hypothetical protein
MNEVLYISVIVALAAAFVILFAKKQGWVEWMQIHGNVFLSKLFSCDYCLSFWTGCVVALALALVLWEPWVIFVPILSTPITRMMV